MTVQSRGGRGELRRALTVHFTDTRGLRADVGHDHRAVHSRPGRPLPRGHGGAVQPAVRHRARRQDHRRGDPPGRPGQHPGQRRARSNVQGEEQQKLDVLANETIKNCLKHTGRVCAMGSEEDEDIIPVPPEYRRRQVRGPLRSPRRLLQHRRQLRGRHDLQHPPPAAAWRAAARWRTCSSRAASRSPRATSCTARARCWSTPPGRACTASRSIPRSASSCCPTSGS